MNKVKYENPFSNESIIYSQKLDNAIDSGNFIELDKLLKEIEKKIPNMDNASQAQLYYSMSTAYELSSKPNSISDDQIFKKRIYFFRKSINIIESDEYLKKEYEPYINEFKLGLYTNYANALSFCGRKIAAISQYKKALNIDATFGMALGNLGILYSIYGENDYDLGHQKLFHHYAYSLLKEAINCRNPNTYENAKKHFESVLSKYSDQYIQNFLSKDIEIPQIIYKDEQELLYRKWAVENNLFLNTLNDLSVNEMCFANDFLHLPDITAQVDSKPIFHGMFNQVKQEYVYARYLYFLSLQKLDEPHFADKENHLINFHDYPEYGIRIEKMKSSFKTLYGLFDKISYFLNFYFNLGIEDRDVNFRQIWLKEFKKGKKHYDYNNILNYKENVALASLYWISRDFYDKFEDSPNPKLKKLSEVRNALEHKYVKITNGWFPERMNGDIDDLTLYITEDELSSLTLELMHVVREAIICLSMSVHIEEKKKHKADGNSLIVSIPMMEYSDDWKL